MVKNKNCGIERLQQLKKRHSENQYMFDIGDIIYWYCDLDDEWHHGQVQSIFLMGLLGPCYSVEVECCGERQIVSVLESDACDREL
jgi:hypothetical protein